MTIGLGAVSRVLPLAMARKNAGDHGPFGSVRRIFPGLGLPTDAPAPLVHDDSASTSQSTVSTRIQPPWAFSVTSPGTPGTSKNVSAAAAADTTTAMAAIQKPIARCVI